MGENLEVGTVTEEELATEQVDTEEETLEQSAEETDNVSEDEGETGDEDERTDEEKEEDTESAKVVKVDANTRVQEALTLAKEATERANKLQAEFEALKSAQEAAVKPFDELTLAEVNSVVETMEDEIQKLREDGHKFEAALANKKLNEYLSYVEDNEKKREEWENKKNSATVDKTTVDSRIEDMKKAAAFYREQRKIPEETWEQAGIFLNDFFTKNPLEGRKFAELAERQGPMAAFEYGEKLIVENVAKQVEAEKKRKETSKDKTVGGRTASTKVTSKPTKDLPIDEYFKKREEEERSKRR
jgi:hypothetical protein